MTFDLAVRLTEILIGFAVFIASMEHMAGTTKARLFHAARAALCVALVAGIAPAVCAAALLLTGVALLTQYDGPYNGGADRMGLLVLFCLTLANVSPGPVFPRVALGYLAVQLVISYFMSGWVKVVNVDWRTGRALSDVFLFSAYPVGENLRAFSGAHRLMLAASVGVIAFELAFPLMLITPWTLAIALSIGAGFHLANACLFGLNRFFWTWIAAYPSVIWLQHFLIG